MASTWRHPAMARCSICRWRCSGIRPASKSVTCRIAAAALALNDVVSGQVKFFFANGSSVVGLIQGGKVKAIAHTGKGKLNSLPDIPPVSATLPGFEAYEWNGVFVPHGTPAPIVQKLNSGINAALRDPNVIARFEQLNIETRPTTPQEFGSFVDEQMARWSKVVKDANIRLG